MKKLQKKRLVVSSNTVRNMVALDLTKVVGGVLISIPCTDSRGPHLCQ